MKAQAIPVPISLVNRWHQQRRRWRSAWHQGGAAAVEFALLLPVLLGLLLGLQFDLLKLCILLGYLLFMLQAHLLGLLFLLGLNHLRVRLRRLGLLHLLQGSF